MFTMRDFLMNPSKYNYSYRYALGLALAENLMYVLLGICIGVVAVSY